jgi:hypothetical protein
VLLAYKELKINEDKDKIFIDVFESYQILSIYYLLIHFYYMISIISIFIHIFEGFNVDICWINKSLCIEQRAILIEAQYFCHLNCSTR